MSAYNVRMPKIIYGTAWKKEDTAGYVEQALACGFKGIDTACQPKHYHEKGVGDALSVCLNDNLKREDIYLQTKFTPVNGQDPERIPYDPKARLSLQVEQSFQTSLDNLKTTYLDGLVLHSPLAKQAELMEVWRAMEAIVSSGACKQLGISNCYKLKQLETLYKKAKIKPAVLQNRFYAKTGYDRELREFCRKHHIIYQSFWTLSANPELLQHELIQNFAEQYQRSTAQIFFRYLSQQGIIPLTGTTSVPHMQNSMALFEFKLSPEECALIDGLLPAA
jgi:diketogulonate reductase-like aldo/keto reductase